MNNDTSRSSVAQLEDRRRRDIRASVDLQMRQVGESICVLNQRENDVVFERSEAIKYQSVECVAMRVDGAHVSDFGDPAEVEVAKRRSA